MNTVAEFVHATHDRSVKMGKRSIGFKDALSIANDIDWSRMSAIADAAREHLPHVQDELSGLYAAHAAHPERMMNRAILFGIATPNRDEQLSIAWGRMAENHIGHVSPHALARKTFITARRDNAKAGFYKSLTRTLEQLETIGARDAWTLDQLESLYGVGPKVARMIMAILNPRATSWTVDLWHQRQLLWAAGHAPNVRCVVSDPGYKILEAVWLEYAERFFPGVDTFAVQWATWCAADGKFCSHAELWQDLAA